ncbi:nucleotide pyrophosphohydrolase [Actinokineospora xionganensis]|uniref:Nucleotide pyrophosphohydrolase n=1 Tax=Actinokineospora xionganensis TaxID=2684470 RepID=A0ABR7L2A5_9PSEU|nr:nucleotide pyrophosphohydrolase [Actinokineospora xionganensis]MBC6446818.1 nucleotide pyrophosphohydrolase [Actinokineospora xionganensis]
MTLEELAERQRAFITAREWEPFHTPKNLVMALTGEVGELTELFQWLTPEQAAAAGADPALRPQISDELADVLLYLVRLADTLGVDLIEAANAKIDRNEHRFPVGDGAHCGLRRVPGDSTR